MKRIAERKSVHWREPIFEIVDSGNAPGATRPRVPNVVRLDRRNTVMHCFNNGSKNR